MNELTLNALSYAWLAGLSIPIGAALACIPRFAPNWLAEEFKHTFLAFGAGALLAAVALVLIPQGITHLNPLQTSLAFAGGAVFFMLIDRALTQHGGSYAMLLAMLLDYLPEALALGASIAHSTHTALLLALLIALQNLPQGFNAFRESMFNKSHNGQRKKLLLGFFLLSLLGPLAAFIGLQFLTEEATLLSFIMVFSAGGILYLIFQDIAPQVPLKNHWAPPLGAVAGFLLGLLGQMLI